MSAHVDKIGSLRPVTLSGRALCRWLLVAAAMSAACGGRYDLDNAYVGYDVDPSLTPHFASPGKDALEVPDASSKGGDIPSTQGPDTADLGGGDTTDPLNLMDGIGAVGDAGEAQDEGADSACEGKKTCSTDAQCPGALCQVGLCVGGCCEIAAAADGTTCSDGSLCTKSDQCSQGACVGIPATCDDGLACTEDSCVPKTGACKAGLSPGWCLVAGVCAADGQASDANACLQCATVKSTTSWSLAPGCCGSDAECPAGGPCEVGTCNLQTNQCELVKTLGCCGQDAECSDGNLCTIDSCDLTTGQCSYQIVNCAAPNECQSGVCDPKSGQCNAQTKAGWCLIDGSCYGEGDANPANGCQTCSSMQAPNQWHIAAGVLCDDGNACTFGDSCNAQAKCQGTAQLGCCTANADCPGSGDPCAPNICNPATLLCTPQVVSGCCTSGSCCDAGSLSIKGAGSQCGGGPVAVEYKCSGQNIQQREIWAACNGQSAQGCQASAQAAGAWLTLKTCGTGTACTASGSAQMPTCQTTTPPGTCAGSCGNQSSSGSCWCDSVCTGAGDCCSDFMAICGCASGECCDLAKSFPKAKGTACGGSQTQYQCSGKILKQRIGTAGCDGKNVCSSAAADVVWGAWTTLKTCSASQNCAAGPDGVAGSCKAIPAGSCNGHCGTQSLDTCWCDDLCKQLGDCCADYAAEGCASVQNCGDVSVGTCNGKCGGQGASSTCWCDSACDMFGDCCADKAVCSCQ